MANVITKSNLFSEARNNVEAIISANVSDPLTSSSQFRKWVYAREPDIKSAGFQSYPFIIIHPSELDIQKQGKSLDRKSKVVAWTIEVEVVSSDRGNGTAGGKGLQYVDSVSNSILEVLNDVTNLNTLRTNGIYHISSSSSTVGTESLMDELVYRRSFIITMSAKIQVSA